MDVTCITGLCGSQNGPSTCPPPAAPPAPSACGATGFPDWRSRSRPAPPWSPATTWRRGSRPMSGRRTRGARRARRCARSSRGCGVPAGAATIRRPRYWRSRRHQAVRGRAPSPRYSWRCGALAIANGSCSRSARAPAGHLSAGRVGELVSELLPDGWTTHTLRHRFASAAYPGRSRHSSGAGTARSRLRRDDTGLHSGARRRQAPRRPRGRHRRLGPKVTPVPNASRRSEPGLL